MFFLVLMLTARWLQVRKSLRVMSSLKAFNDGGTQPQRFSSKKWILLML